jgi:hypothetical protein
MVSVRLSHLGLLLCEVRPGVRRDRHKEAMPRKLLARFLVRSPTAPIILIGAWHRQALGVGRHRA